MKPEYKLGMGLAPVLDDQPASPAESPSHSFTCPVCHAPVDTGDLAQTLFHGRSAHRYDARRNGVGAKARAWNAIGSTSRS